MKNTTILLLIVIVFAISCSTSPVKEKAKLTIDDIRFCYERELWDIIREYEEDIEQYLVILPYEEVLYDVLESLALSEQDTLKYIDIVDIKVHNLLNLNDALRVVGLLKSYSEELLTDKIASYLTLFDNTVQQLMIKWQAGIISEEEMIAAVTPLSSYPVEFEVYVKRYIDEVAVERDDSLRVVSCAKFATDFPASAWQDMNRYLMIVSLLNLQEYQQVVTIIKENDSPSAALAYQYASILQNPALRKNYLNGNENNDLLVLSLQISRNSLFPKGKDIIKVGYNDWDKDYWRNKSALLAAKTIYFIILSEAAELWGDENLIVTLDNYSEDLYNQGFSLLLSINYENNDFGEIAELKYWQGRYAVLAKNISPSVTAEYFIDCLIAGAPRNRFDLSAFEYLSHLHEQQGINGSVMDWCRTIKHYSEPVFKDVTINSGLADQKSSRVAVADYDNDGYTDILLNGRWLFRNNGDFTFTDVTEQAGLINQGFVGGLWADFNKDGNIDIASFSRNVEGEGDKLFAGNSDGTFSMDADSNINDLAPTEGAAWIDIDQNGFPSLYMANYEQWQIRTGFEDYFWFNDKGKFIDKSEELGFRTPKYTTDPGLAGRGVSPADYNNDGVQSIFVSNYRLCRNFLWDNVGGNFIDNAALNGVRGHLEQGYYGHTIGADWGDFNNNGKLDLFLCNLAHPRYLAFSDISMLLRNDGVKQRKIGERTINYHLFTDITKEAGITFDELHSDPNWLDTNNNGYLDLYMTSIYENDRSYLYLNNQDDTFRDVTFLSETRVYNGWGNAAADFNNDGRIDIIVGSGSGVKLFMNITENNNKAVFFKPYWDRNEVRIVDKNKWNSSIPNSPAFGTRIQVRIKDNENSEKLIIRELNGGKGTTSQNDQFLHFGIGEGELIEAKIWTPASSENTTDK